jgi:hypothetical protein
MEVPGRDVTADPLGPEPIGSPGAEGDEGGDGGEEGLTDKVKKAAEKAKDAVTPDDDDR